jgi:hypothetical protein
MHLITPSCAFYQATESDLSELKERYSIEVCINCDPHLLALTRVSGFATRSSYPHPVPELTRQRCYAHYS